MRPKVNPKRWLRIITISLFLGIVLAEILLRTAVATLATHVLPDQTTEPGFLAHYRNSAYATPEFLAAIGEVFPHGGPNPDDEWSIGDLHLPGFTVQNDERLTTDQPKHYTRTVWLFGNSSIWGIHVDDAHTISSYLQREFNGQGIPWRVRNMSQPGIEIEMERYWLTKSAIQSGDLVIFIDGKMELNQAIAITERRWKAANPVCITADRIPLMLLSLWCQAAAMYYVPIEYAERSKALEFNRYWHKVSLANSYVLSHDATFVHLIQPSPILSADYVELARRDAILSMCAECWFDEFHYDDEGNALIARQIADFLEL